METLRVHVNDRIFVGDFVAQIIYAIKEAYNTYFDKKEQPKQEKEVKKTGSRGPPTLKINVKDQLKVRAIFGGK